MRVSPSRSAAVRPRAPALGSEHPTQPSHLVVCPALSFAPLGDVALTNGGTYPSTATYTCEGGAAPSDGDQVLTCLPTGAWSGTAPTSCFSIPEEGFEFTTLGTTGMHGPTSAAGYAGTPLEGQVALQGGMQLWTVPKTGTYRIASSGASGVVRAPPPSPGPADPQPGRARAL